MNIPKRESRHQSSRSEAWEVGSGPLLGFGRIEVAVRAPVVWINSRRFIDQRPPATVRSPICGWRPLVYEATGVYPNHRCSDCHLDPAKAKERTTSHFPRL